MNRPKNARYLVSLAEDGAFLVYDRNCIHKRTARYLPAEFVSGQGSFNPTTIKYPDYVHGQLWALHDGRSRAQFAKAQAAHASA